MKIGDKRIYLGRKVTVTGYLSGGPSSKLEQKLLGYTPRQAVIAWFDNDGRLQEKRLVGKELDLLQLYYPC